MAVIHWCLVLMLVVTPPFTIVSLPVGGYSKTKDLGKKNMYENRYLNYQYEEEEKSIISKRTLNLIVVPGGAAVKLDDPNKEPDVPPKGLDAVLVVPNNPPLLVLVPKAAKQFKQLHRSIMSELFF